MRRPAELRPWFSVEQRQAWVTEAPDQAAYQRRLAIWLTQLGPYHAEDVGTMLAVSKQAVWKWVGEYNAQGPTGLEGQRRGGLRWGLLSLEQERALLARYEARAQTGDVITAKQLHAEIWKAVGQDVSLAYVYKLLHRQDWRKLGPRPRHVKRDAAARAAFKQTLPKRSG
jgi:transposase